MWKIPRYGVNTRRTIFNSNHLGKSLCVYTNLLPASPPLLAWIPITTSTHHNLLHIPQQEWKRVELYYFSKSFYCPPSSNFISISSCRICLLSLVLDTDIIRPISPVLYRKIKPEFIYPALMVKTKGFFFGDFLPIPSCDSLNFWKKILVDLDQNFGLKVVRAEGSSAPHPRVSV